MRKIIVTTLLFTTCCAFAQSSKFDKDYSAIESKVIEWRRDIHQNPELSNQEFKTAAKIAAHLKSLGIEVTTGVAKTGVVGILKGQLALVDTSRSKRKTFYERQKVNATGGNGD